MVALKGRSVETFLARLEPSVPVVLLYGPDYGLVAERARAVVARVLGEAAADPFRAPVLSGEAIVQDPARLADEVYSVPLFGGRKAVRIRPAGDALAPAVGPLLRSPPEDALVILEAGDLRPGAALRKLVEQAANGVAIGCYRDSDADLARIIAEELGPLAQRMSPSARALLSGLIGGDRGASRQELQKLALYAMGKSELHEAEILAVLGDAGAVEMDDLIDCAFDGRAEEVATGLRRLFELGADAGVIAAAALRRADMLSRLSAKMDSGASLEAALASHRPPLFYKRRESCARALRSWRLWDLHSCAERLREAVILTRERPALAQAAIERALLSVALQGTRQATV